MIPLPGAGKVRRRDRRDRGGDEHLHVRQPGVLAHLDRHARRPEAIDVGVRQPELGPLPVQVLVRLDDEAHRQAGGLLGQQRLGDVVDSQPVDHEVERRLLVVDGGDQAAVEGPALPPHHLGRHRVIRLEPGRVDHHRHPAGILRGVVGAGALARAGIVPVLEVRRARNEALRFGIDVVPVLVELRLEGADEGRVGGEERHFVLVVRRREGRQLERRVVRGPERHKVLAGEDGCLPVIDLRVPGRMVAKPDRHALAGEIVERVLRVQVDLEDRAAVANQPHRHARLEAIHECRVDGAVGEIPGRHVDAHGLGVDALHQLCGDVVHGREVDLIGGAGRPCGAEHGNEPDEAQSCGPGHPVSE